MMSGILTAQDFVLATHSGGYLIQMRLYLIYKSAQSVTRSLPKPAATTR
jgi:hypothetical protein